MKTPFNSDYFKALITILKILGCKKIASALFVFYFYNIHDRGAFKVLGLLPTTSFGVGAMGAKLTTMSKRT